MIQRKTPVLLLGEAAALLGLILLGPGCGMRHSNPVGPYPTVQTLTTDGWSRYDGADYPAAAALFTQVKDFQADYAESYVGLAWCALQMGSFGDVHSWFDFAMVSRFYFSPDSSVGFPSQPDSAIQGENSPVDTVGGTVSGTWTITPVHYPLLGVIAVSGKVVDMTGNTLLSGTLTIKTFTDLTIVVNRDAQLDSAARAGGRLETQVDYYYYNSTQTWTRFHADAYTANASGYQAENQDMMAIVMANTVLRLDSTYVFTHYPQVSARGLHLLLAQSYYNLQYYDRSQAEVDLIPGHATLNPSSPTYLYDLQHEIERLKNM